MSQKDFLEIDISKIDVDKTNKYHFRKLIKQDTVDAIVESLEHGPLYQPIIVTKSEDGRYQVVDGEHRLLAHRKLDKEQIRALIIPERDAVIWGVKANILRSDYTPMEKSNALQRLYEIQSQEKNEAKKYNKDALAKEVGLTKSSISEYLRLQDLPDEIKELAVNDPYSSIKTLRAIARSKKEKTEKISLYEERAAKAKRAAQNREKSLNANNDKQDKASKEGQKTHSRLYLSIKSQKHAIDEISGRVTDTESKIQASKNDKDFNRTELEDLICDVEVAIENLTSKVTALRNTFSSKD